MKITGFHTVLIPWPISPDSAHLKMNYIKTEQEDILVKPEF